MSDLISRSALLEELNSYHYDTKNSVTRRIEHIVTAHFIELIEKRSTAFDLDKIIDELQKLKTYNLTISDQMSEIMRRAELGTYVCLEDVIKLIKRHIYDTEEHSKTDFIAVKGE